MNNLENTNTPKKKKKRGCLAYGCLTIIVIGLVIAAIGTAIFLYGKKQINPFVDKYIAAINNEQYDVAYSNLISSAWRSSASVEEFTSFESNVKKIIGNCNSKSLQNVHISKNIGTLPTAVAGYDAQYDKGPVFLDITLVKENEKWLVQHIKYNSELFIQAMTCKECGKPNKDLGKFCAFCSKPMR